MQPGYASCIIIQVIVQDGLGFKAFVFAIDVINHFDEAVIVRHFSVDSQVL